MLATLLVALAMVERHPSIGGRNIEVGMTKVELEAINGLPDEVSRDLQGGEAWIYYRDYLCLRFYAVRFSPDGLIEGVWN